MNRRQIGRGDGAAPNGERQAHMLYAFLLYHEADVEFPPDAMDQHFATHRRASERGAYVASEALGTPQTATTVRQRNGTTIVSDGPFAETKEVFGGFYLLDCKDLDEALEYANMLPVASVGAVEVRPCREVPGWPYGATASFERAPMQL
jgi:hypothetical protein